SSFSERIILIRKSTPSIEWLAALSRAAFCSAANSFERPPGFAETPGSQLGLPALPMAISFMLHRVLLTLHWATAALASKGLGAANLLSNYRLVLARSMISSPRAAGADLFTSMDDRRGELREH